MSDESMRAKLRSIIATCEGALRDLAGSDDPIGTTGNLYVSPKQYAQHRAVHPDTVYNWLKLGMPTSRVGRRYRIHVARADEWLDRCDQPTNVREAAAEVARGTE